jgi:hypothetical protein
MEGAAMGASKTGLLSTLATMEVAIHHPGFELP